MAWRYRERSKPSRPPAIRLILFAEVATEALLFAAYLQQHDNDEGDIHQQRLPGPEPDAYAGEIDETARQHGVAAQAVGALSHQVLRAGRHLVPEGVHGVAVALAPHVDDGPHAERQPKHRQHNGDHHPGDGNIQQVGHPRSQPHQGRDEEDEHQAAEGIAEDFSEFAHIRRAILSSESGLADIGNRSASRKRCPRLGPRA